MNISKIRSYQIEKEHEDCLKIYANLLCAFHKCDQIESRYLNIVAIFFPQLIKLLTGILLKRNELSNSYIFDSNLQLHNPLQNFPYIGYYEILNQSLNTSEKNYSPDYILNKKYRLLNYIGNYFLRKPKIALYDLSCDTKYITKRLIYKGYCPYFPSVEKLCIPNFYEQLDLLEESFDETVQQFDLPIKTCDIVQLFDKFCSPYLSNNNKSIIFDVLITGTLQNLEARILAAKARSQDIPVISLSHGDGDQLVVDEPRTGYGELTYSNIFIGYGEGGKKNIQNSKYLHSLFEEPYFVPANSDVCQQVYSHSQRIKSLSEYNDPTYIYVPTKYVDYLRYGPYHSMPDKLYYEWQKTIYAMFPDAIYKKHPKLFCYDTPFKKIINDNFKTCYENADVFLFDVIATAFNVAAATDKPIIYFNLGVRNLHPEVIPLIKERCIWVDVRDNKSSRFIQLQIHSQRDKTLRNNYTRQFCIIDSDQKREDAVITVVDSILS